jgi:lipoprotein-releasing system ATP-binding protein
MSPITQANAEYNAASSTPALRASGICKGYGTPAGRLEVLTGVDLEVPRGTILAILGASGSGKSTLLNILGTLDRADQGTLEVGGLALQGLSDARIANLRSRRLGFVFQFHHLLPEFDAMENVMMPLLIAGVKFGEAAERAREALTRVGLLDRWEHRPSELSGGEAQRVAVARALVSKPELVLADEPSGNLDPAAADELHHLMASLARDQHQTFVIVTHNDRLAAVAHRVLTLASGRLSATGREG